MEIKVLDRIDDAEWDRAIQSWPDRLVYHHSAWLGFLANSRSGLQVIRYQISQNGRSRGYFVGGLEKKGPFRLLGSPLYGWYTDFMGPVSDEELDVEEFLEALETWCRRNRIHFIQIGHPSLPPEIMSRQGYIPNEMMLYYIPLNGSQEIMWNGLSGKARNRIRKGGKNDLLVEECHDESIVEEYYAQHVEVFAHQGLRPKYPIQTVMALVRTLQAADMILLLRIRSRGETIATGLFPHDDRHLYSFGIASRINSRHLCPNELLYWNAMKWGGSRGLQSFCIGHKYREPETGGVFKEKFNASQVAFRRYAKALSLPLRTAYWLRRNFEKMRHH